jgi:adenylate cyclase
MQIARFTDEFQLRADVAEARLGRTRIGIETGTVIVGDVGGGAKLDYTAHGDAINTAARLEALNNELGTTICVGPECRARVRGIPFHFHGEIAIKGRGKLAVFEPLEPGDRAETAA